MIQDLIFVEQALAIIDLYKEKKPENYQAHTRWVLDTLTKCSTGDGREGVFAALVVTLRYKWYEQAEDVIKYADTYPLVIPYVIRAFGIVLHSKKHNPASNAYRKKSLVLRWIKKYIHSKQAHLTKDVGHYAYMALENSHHLQIKEE